MDLHRNTKFCGVSTPAVDDSSDYFKDCDASRPQFGVHGTMVHNGCEEGCQIVFVPIPACLTASVAALVDMLS